MHKAIKMALNKQLSKIITHQTLKITEEEEEEDKDKGILVKRREIDSALDKMHNNQEIGGKDLSSMALLIITKLFPKNQD